MATVIHGSTWWLGNGFAPGVEHYWSWDLGGNAWGVEITACPSILGDSEAMVKDLRVQSSTTGLWTALFSVINTGTTTIRGYSLNFTKVGN